MAGIRDAAKAVKRNRANDKKKAMKRRVDKLMADTARAASAKKKTPRPTQSVKLGAKPTTRKPTGKTHGNIMQVIRQRKNLPLKY